MRKLVLVVSRALFDLIRDGREDEVRLKKAAYWTRRLFKKDGSPRDFDIVAVKDSPKQSGRRIELGFGGVTEVGGKYVIQLKKHVAEEPPSLRETKPPQRVPRDPSARGDRSAQNDPSA
jgi:hypothetical protein